MPNMGLKTFPNIDNSMVDDQNGGQLFSALRSWRSLTCLMEQRLALQVELERATDVTFDLSHFRASFNLQSSGHPQSIG